MRQQGSTRVFPSGNSVPFFKISSLSRVVPQWENNVLVVYEAMDDFGDLKKDAMFGSECSCRLFVYVWGVSVMCVRTDTTAVPRWEA